MPPLVVLCSAPADSASLEEFLVHLQPWEPDGTLRLWHEGLMKAGDHVAIERRDQAVRADVLCVLCSPHLLADGARLADVRAARDAGRRVVPVLVRACQWRANISPVAGLQPLPRDERLIPRPGDPAADEIWNQVTEALLDLLRERPPLTPRGSLRPIFSAALRLDRGRQWTLLIERCAQPAPVIFFLGGHVRQRVGLFADRVCDHLGRERPDRHRVVVLKYRDLGHCPHTAAEWEARLGEALGGRGALPDLLRRAAEDRPLLVLLGKRPFRQAFLGEAEAGLRAFLGQVLPAALRQAAPAHPVRVLVLAEYKGEPERALLGRLRGALDEAGAAGLVIEDLPEPDTPRWADVEQLLSAYSSPPAAEVVARIRRAFDAVIASEDPDLMEIARALEALDQDEDDDE